MDGKVNELKRQTKRLMRKQNKFDAPIEKLDQTRANRKMYYEQTVKRISKWDGAVKKLRHDEVQEYFKLLFYVGAESMLQRFSKISNFLKRIRMKSIKSICS